MHINQSEERRLSHLQTRSVSVDSGFDDEEVINKTDIQTALERIKKGKRKFEKWQKKSLVDIRNIRDEEGSNIFHLITRLKKKQKCRSLNFLIGKISNEDLVKLFNSKNLDGKTPLQVGLIDKITKTKHRFYKIQDNDNTLKFFIKLLGHGASPNGLMLYKEELQSLDERQKIYYRKFLERIVKSVGKSDLDLETKNSVIIKAAEIIYDGYPLHKTVLENDKEKFSKLLQRGYDITNQDKDGNALHLIVTALKKEEKLIFLNILLKVCRKEQFIKAVNNKNGDGQTPLHQLLQCIKEKSKKSLWGKKIQNIVKKDFKDTSRYKILELLLRNGADITIQDKEGNNALHHIASLKGEKKVTCLKLISSLVEEGSILKEQLSKAINATNKEEQTPLQVALIKKVEKGEHILQKNTIFDPAINYDNTTKFCVKLLQNGANPDSLDLKDEKFHTDSYYLVLRDLKDYRKTPYAVKEKAREMKEQLEKKYNIKTFSGQLHSTAKSVGSSIKEVASNTGKALFAVTKYIDPASRTRELLAITITFIVIAIAAFAFFQGQVGIGAAIPIIAIAGVVCFTLTLGFSCIKKLFEDSTDKVKNLIDNDQQNLAKNSKEQKPPDQFPKNPGTKVDDPLITSSARLEQISRIINKPFSPGR